MIGAMFTLATVAMILVCLWANRVSEDARDVFAMAAIVGAFTALSRIVSGFLDPPASMMWWPVQDAVMVLLCMAAHNARPAKWKWDLACCFVGQLLLHAWFWIGNDGSRHMLRDYIGANNVLFGFELLILSIEGGRHVARHAFGRAGLVGRGAVGAG